MRILLVGGSGVIGSKVKEVLLNEKFEVITASPNSGDIKVDITDFKQIDKMFQEVGEVDGIVLCPKSKMSKGPLMEMDAQKYNSGLQTKLLGQVEVALKGIRYVKENGSITLTSGIMNYACVPNGSSGAMVNGAIDAFVQAAAHEMPNNIRLNAVSPTIIKEVIEKYGNTFKGYEGVPVEKAAKAYLQSVMGIVKGRVIKIWD